jgi:hypothetical protein
MCTGQRLNIHTPLGRVQLERLQSTALAQALHFVDDLVATIIP